MRKILVLLLIAAVPLLVWLLLQPIELDTERQDSADLPWMAEISPGGRLRVFGIELGRTILAKAASRWGERPEVGLFVQAGGDRSLEAYFGSLRLGLLQARLVAVLGADSETLARYAAAAVNAEPMPSGARRLELSEAHRAETFELPIRALTYIPRADYDRELVGSRFGEPDERLKASGGSYWLYPERGIAIRLDQGRTVIHYVLPGQFAALRDRLAGKGR